MHIPLTIESIAYRGAGVARHENLVHFVPGTCPGEDILAEVVREKPTFRESRVVQIVKASPDRLAQPDCLVATPDGNIPVPGCVYGHATHEAELGYKQEQLLSFLTRQGGVAQAAEIVLPFVASSQHLHYRNKITLHAGRDAQGRQVLGYIGEDNVTVVDLPQCPLAVPPINRLLTEIRADRDFWPYVEEAGSVILRWTESDGAVVIPISGDGEDPTPPLTETVPGLGQIRVPARGFFQVNPAVGVELLQHVLEAIESAAPEELIDGYCGVGVFGLSASKRRIRHVQGFDSGRDVIRAANDNARRYGLPTRFFCEYFARVISRALEQLRTRKRMVVLDPPRAGLEPEVVAALRAHPVEHLVYVSCAPDTLARDLAKLTRDGLYAVVSARLFDMFPRTAHFETVVVMRKA